MHIGGDYKRIPRAEETKETKRRTERERQSVRDGERKTQQNEIIRKTELMNKTSNTHSVEMRFRLNVNEIENY